MADSYTSCLEFSTSFGILPVSDKMMQHLSPWDFEKRWAFVWQIRLRYTGGRNCTSSGSGSSFALYVLWNENFC